MIYSSNIQDTLYIGTCYLLQHLFLFSEVRGVQAPGRAPCHLRKAPGRRAGEVESSMVVFMVVLMVI